MTRAEVDIKCRIHKMAGVSAPDAQHAISTGAQACPMRRTEIVDLNEPERGDNITGDQLAKKFPDKCTYCKLTPDWTDFSVRKIL